MENMSMPHLAPSEGESDLEFSNKYILKEMLTATGSILY